MLIKKFSKEIGCEPQDLKDSPRDILTGMDLEHFTKIKDKVDRFIQTMNRDLFSQEDEVFIQTVKDINFALKCRHEHIKDRLQIELIKKIGEDQGVDFSKVSSDYLQSFQDTILKTRKEVFSHGTSVSEIMSDNFVMNFSNMALANFVNLISI